MLASTLFTLLAAGFVSSAPLNRRVTLDAAATAEESRDRSLHALAQVRDNTATRAFTATTIQTNDGKCLSVDPFSGDFRENLTPVVAVTCDGSKNQTWDVITSGVHNNVKGQALIVSSLTQACLNFDPRRAAGNQVLLFSCGGRADGGGQVTDSQLFSFAGGAGPLPLLPQNGKNATCLTITANNALDQTACNAATASGAELFTFGAAAANAGSGADASTSAAVDSTTSAADASATSDCPPSTVTVTVTVTTDSAAATSTDAVTSSAAAATSTDVASTSSTVAATTTTSKAAASTSTKIAVAGSGGFLNEQATEEAQKKDLTATRAATGAQIKTSDGQCLSVNATAGDFRENLIPIEVKACDGSVGQQFDFITSGVHNNQAGQTLIVSSLTQGCLNFDDRRAAGDQVIIFSCGGRADGDGQVTNSQLFPFTTADLTKPYALTPSNSKGVCFINDNGRLGNTNCDTANPAANELFTIVA